MYSRTRKAIEARSKAIENSQRNEVRFYKKQFSEVLLKWADTWDDEIYNIIESDLTADSQVVHELTALFLELTGKDIMINIEEYKDV